MQCDGVIVYMKAQSNGRGAYSNEKVTVNPECYHGTRMMQVGEAGTRRQMVVQQLGQDYTR
ncbi:hypothetical protein SAMD00023353_1002580 [Rosellinia necatrix]|uniref:Uncharacterized protein n=1 Tax=Rosellinia necatrix TaxID=77044 RepID=A0A1W2TBH6_ROSNE|nr:hypothetical protein SAMD00023353_1002580 [Rosellinia necatrix]